MKQLTYFRQKFGPSLILFLSLKKSDIFDCQGCFVSEYFQIPDFLKILKSEPETREIPVIVTSILSEKERAFEMGADEYLVKPFDSQKLFAFLATLHSSNEKSVISDFGRFLNARRQKFSRNFLGKRNVPSLDSGTKILLVDDDKDTQYVLK